MDKSTPSLSKLKTEAHKLRKNTFIENGDALDELINLIIAQSLKEFSEAVMVEKRQPIEQDEFGEISSYVIKQNIVWNACRAAIKEKVTKFMES